MNVQSENSRSRVKALHRSVLDGGQLKSLSVKTMRILSRCICLLGMIISQTACETSSYYHQAAKGQISLLTNTRPVAEVIDDSNTSIELREKLLLTQNILTFAERRGLDVDGSYGEYVALDRSHVVWNVFVTQPHSVVLEQWCYPIAGCVSYKGFFAQADADNFATKMHIQGKQSYVGGVAAYSTLGWFNDPLLSTFIYRNDLDLAALLFHELAHKVIYVADDTVFNESFATAVERILLLDWIKTNDQDGLYQGDAIDAEVVMQHLLRQRRRAEVVNLIVEAKNGLSFEFAKEADLKFKEAARVAVISGLRMRYKQLSSQWGDNPPFDYWMSSDINNPKLAAIGAYSQWVPAFLALYDVDKASPWGNFISQVHTLSKQPKAQRNETLTRLASGYKRE